MGAYSTRTHACTHTPEIEAFKSATRRNFGYRRTRHYSEKRHFLKAVAGSRLALTLLPDFPRDIRIQYFKTQTRILFFRCISMFAYIVKRSSTESVLYPLSCVCVCDCDCGASSSRVSVSSGKNPCVALHGTRELMAFRLHLVKVLLSFICK